MYTNIKEDTLRNHFCWGKKRGQKCLSNYSSTIYSPEWNQAFKIFMSPPFKTQGTHTWRQCLCLICFGLELGLTKYVQTNIIKFFSISFLISIATLIAAKGQLISKGILNSSKKFDLTTMIHQVDLFWFVFWKNLKILKRHFEINWPLTELV